MGRPDCTPFVILFTGRTGSSHLTRLLRSHPEVRAAGERLGRMKNEGADAQAQLEWVRTQLEPRGRFRAVGFKAKPRQPIDLDGFTEILRERGARIIRMERRNIVKHVISHMNVSRVRSTLGRPNATESQGPLPAAAIDPSELKRFLQRLEAYEAELSEYVTALGLEAHHVAYEELLADEETVVNGVLDFLGVQRRALTSTVRKSTSDDLREAIVNFDEVSAALRGTRYEPMLEEVQVAAATRPG